MTMCRKTVVTLDGYVLLVFDKYNILLFFGVFVPYWHDVSEQMCLID